MCTKNQQCLQHRHFFIIGKTVLIENNIFLTLYIIFWRNCFSKFPLSFIWNMANLEQRYKNGTLITTRTDIYVVLCCDLACVTCKNSGFCCVSLSVQQQSPSSVFLHNIQQEREKMGLRIKATNSPSVSPYSFSPRSGKRTLQKKVWDWTNCKKAHCTKRSMEVHVHFLCERKEKLEGSFIRPKGDFYIFYVIRAEKGRRLFCNNLSAGEEKERNYSGRLRGGGGGKGCLVSLATRLFFPFPGHFLAMCFSAMRCVLCCNDYI